MKKMSKTTLTSTIALVLVIVAVILVALFMPNNKTTTSSKSTSKTLSSSAQTAAIQAAEVNFKSFFSANTTMAERQKLLQNGSQFAQAMSGEFTQLSNEAPSVIINSASLTNATTLKLNYTVELNAQPVLPNQNGEALKIGGVWQVSDATFCQLLSLAGTPPTVCSNVH